MDRARYRKGERNIGWLLDVMGSDDEACLRGIDVALGGPHILHVDNRFYPLS